MGSLERGLTVGILSISLAMTSGCESSSPKNTTQSSVEASPQLPEIENVKGLAKGDKITDIRILTPKAGLEENFLLRASSTKGVEDLAVIYSPEWSELAKSTFKKPIGESEAIAYLVTSTSTAIGLSIVIFDKATQEVLKFSPGQVVEKPSLLYTYASGDKQFSVGLEPLNEGEVRVVFDGMPPYRQYDGDNILKA